MVLASTADGDILVVLYRVFREVPTLLQLLAGTMKMSAFQAVWHGYCVGPTN